MISRTLQALLLSLLALALAWPQRGAAEETREIRVIQIYGLSYLPLILGVDHRIFERELAARGLPGAKVTLVHAASGAVANDMLLSGSADIAVGGVTVLATLWDKTRGRDSEVRGIAPLAETPMYLTTIDPRIRSLRDYGPGDKIAVNAVKVTLQAVMLEIAAAKEFGWEERFRLDPLTVSLGHPEAVAAMLSDRLEIKSYVATIPFNFQVTADPRVRQLLTSYEVLGGPHTTSAAWTTKKWKEANPNAFAALAAGFEKAMDAIEADRREAAAVYLRNEKSGFTAEQILDFISRPGDIRYTPVPHRVMEVVGFMNRIGTIRNAPADWRDLFWENLKDKPGS